MSDINPIDKLFTKDISKEVFISRYNELKTQSGTTEDFSIFENDLSGSIDLIYDTIDTNHDNNIDEGELKTLKDYDTTDGNQVLSESDLKILYDKAIENILSKYTSQTPQELYQDNVIKNKIKPSVIGESVQTAYKSQLACDSDTLQQLINARRNQAFAKISRFQNELNDLILNHSNLSEKEKNEYRKKSNELTEKRKLLKEKEDALARLQVKIRTKNNESEYKNNKTKEYLTNKVSQLQNEISKLNFDIKTLKESQQNIINKSSGSRSDFDRQKKELTRKITQEEIECQTDIGNYSNKIILIDNVHKYALSQSSNMSEVVQNYSDSDTAKPFTGDAKTLKDIWGKGHPNLSNGFYNKAIEISKRIGCNPNDLLAVMQAESGISTTIQNKNSRATGLIQFMPTTAKELGTSTEALKQMSPEQQLVFVEKYLQMTKKRAGFNKDEKLNPSQLYMLVFSPKYAKCSMNEAVYKQGSLAYKLNRGLDRNKKGYITMADLNLALERHKPKSLKNA